jgi:hypothetical protein
MEPARVRRCDRPECVAVGGEPMADGATCMLCNRTQVCNRTQHGEPDPGAPSSDLEIALRSVKALREELDAIKLSLGCENSYDVAGFAQGLAIVAKRHRDELARAAAIIGVVAELAEACADGVPSAALKLLVAEWAA